MSEISRIPSGEPYELSWEEQLYEIVEESEQVLRPLAYAESRDNLSRFINNPSFETVHENIYDTDEAGVLLRSLGRDMSLVSRYPSDRPDRSSGTRFGYQLKELRYEEYENRLYCELSQKTQGWKFGPKVGAYMPLTPNADPETIYAVEFAPSRYMAENTYHVPLSHGIGELPGYFRCMRKLISNLLEMTPQTLEVNSS